VEGLEAEGEVVGPQLRQRVAQWHLVRVTVRVTVTVRVRVRVGVRVRVRVRVN
jgi:hypothetical protein